MSDEAKRLKNAAKIAKDPQVANLSKDFIALVRETLEWVKTVAPSPGSEDDFKGDTRLRRRMDGLDIRGSDVGEEVLFGAFSDLLMARGFHAQEAGEAGELTVRPEYQKAENACIAAIFAALDSGKAPASIPQGNQGLVDPYLPKAPGSQVPLPTLREA